ncbi:MAG TPA: benzoate-CoA ligase family protein [Thermoanaerobaculia bacterium]|nr:benzoate-CoA ligase family protein [Thermoanaerobaculia bacterium]
MISAVASYFRAADHLPLRFNSAEWFVGRHVREGRGGSVAIIDGEGSMTYAQLDEAVRRFASVIREAGARRDERIAFIAPDSRWLSIGFWGAIAAGAVAVPVNTMLKPADFRYVVDDCGARIVVVDPSILDPSELSAADAEVWTIDEMRRRFAAASPRDAFARTHRDGMAFFLYSSGTTGEPKAVVHLQHDMWVCCETYGKSVLQIRPGDRCFSVAKLFFAYGLGNAQYFPFHVGASAVLFAGRPVPEAVFEQVRRHRPTLFYAVPTAFANMLAAMDAGAAADFSSVRVCISAGEALPAAVLERWKERTRLDILDGIGSTEICHIFLTNRAGEIRPGSSGKPVEGYEVRIVGENGATVRPGELGDLLVRGDSTMALYWNKHDATSTALHGEWIRTGDKYLQDSDGFFFHAGRSDDMIKAGGIWVSPVEVEGTLIRHPAVAECAVVGIPDSDGLDKPHAVVVLRSGIAAGDGLAGDLRAFVKESLAPYKCPKNITFVTELPKTATGKLKRFLLRDELRRRER